MPKFVCEIHLVTNSIDRYVNMTIEAEDYFEAKDIFEAQYGSDNCGIVSEAE